VPRAVGNHTVPFTRLVGFKYAIVGSFGIAVYLGFTPRM